MEEKKRGSSESEAIMDGIKFTKPITGLLLMNAKYDSNGNPIDSSKKYHVAKDSESKKIIIIPADETEKPN